MTSVDPTHLPRQAVALAVLEPQIAYLAALDVHPGLSHGVLGHSGARLRGVGDDLRDGADVRPPVGFVFVGRIRRVVPREHLGSGRCKKTAAALAAEEGLVRHAGLDRAEKVEEQ